MTHWRSLLSEAAVSQRGMSVIDGARRSNRLRLTDRDRVAGVIVPARGSCFVSRAP